MATILDLQDRGLRYGVIVDAAATPATLAGIERAGLRYKVEVASGITAADRAILDRRGLQYFVPVSATVSMADRAILERQGLRYAVPVDADILPADLAILERQGLSYFVEVDSSGNAIATAAGGGLLLVDEANGFATDFTHAVDAERVALKTAGATTYSTVDGFYTQSGTSPKMVYDAAGVLGWSPHNLALQSAMGRPGFEWSGNSAIYTGGQSDPSGGNEALQVVVTGNAAGNNVGTLISGLTSGVTYANSAWVKGTAGQQIYFGTDNATSQLLVTFTGEWQRVSATYTLSGVTYYYVGFECYNRSGGAHLPNVTFQCWGMQFQRAPAASTAYLPTTTAARVGLALDYDPVTHAAKGLLCEPQGTNLLLASQDLSSMTIDQGSLVNNNQTGPDGALTADTFTESTAVGPQGYYAGAAYTANADHTVSRYYKMGTRRYATIGWADGTNGAYAVYDLQSGVVGSSAAFGTGVLNSASIQACPSGWYRCILSAKVNSATMYTTFCTANAATITADAYGRQSFVGTGATLIFGHAQVETGTVATSPIPTAGSQVTRAADNYNLLPASINFSATAGSWWVETYLLDASADRYIIGGHNAFSPMYHNINSI